MIVKVDGLTNANNIKEVSALAVDMLGMCFDSRNPRYVSSIGSLSGTIPDSAGMDSVTLSLAKKRVGLFCDDMPQTVITTIVGYQLDFVELGGNETAVYIDNLRHTLQPHIAPKVKIMKTLTVGAGDINALTQPFEGVADMLVFRLSQLSAEEREKAWKAVENYSGQTPFLISGAVSEGDMARINAVRSQHFAGVSVGEAFERTVGEIDTQRLAAFLTLLR